MKFLKTNFLLFLFLLTISSLVPKTARAQNSDLVINEIGAFETSDYEWIEIYNHGSEPIDLTGWKFFEDETNHGLKAYQGDLVIEPKEYAIIANKADKFIAKYNFSGTVIDSSWSSLNESGEAIALKDASGSIVESFTYLPAPNHSLERANPDLADYTSANWQENASGQTAGTQNSNYSLGAEQTSPPPAEETQPNLNPTPNQSTNSAPAFGDVVINEFVSDPADGEEWVELFNKTKSSIDLTGWTIEDGSESVTPLSGQIGYEGNNRFFVIEKIKGNLNNPGDLIILKHPSGLIIDQVAYGNWNDGNLEDNAPKASDPNSVARLADGYNTRNNANDFRVTSIITKGGPNIISNSEIDPNQTSTNQTYSQEIIINELFPNPPGPDNEKEFIELKNLGSTTLDLAGWKLSDNSTKAYQIKKENFPSTLIKGGGFFVLTRQITGLALNNTGGDAAKLYWPNNQLVETVEYHEAAEEDQSYSRDQDGSWSWTTTPTAGEENIITLPNKPPQAVIEAPTEAEAGAEIKFDASDSTDPENQPLTYLWDFGDNQTSPLVNPAHIFNEIGLHKITLTVTDSQGAKDQQKFKLKIKGKSKEMIISNDSLIDSSKIVVINEFLPNPAGSDESEWIELKNLGSAEIDLAGWKIDDSEGGSRPYTLPPETIIKANGFLLLERQKTKIALNNTSDSVRLFNSAGDLVDQIDYEEAKESLAFARDQDGNWSWTKTPTAGGENLITPLVETKISKTAQNQNRKIKSNDNNFIETTLEQVREQDLGDRVRVKGVVAAEPGLLGRSIFYLAGSGIQIYSSVKNQPHLKLGDLVEVTGVLGQSNDETRIRLASADDLKFIKHQAAPEPKPIENEEISEALEGYLVKVEGEVLDQKGQTIYLDTGLQEIPVYLKSTTNIKKPNLKNGDHLAVIGIVSQTKSGYRLLPRYSSDLQIQESPSSVAQSSNLTATNTKDEVIKYLTVTAGALTLVLAGLMIKNKETIKNYFRRNK